MLQLHGFRLIGSEVIAADSSHNHLSKFSRLHLKLTFDLCCTLNVCLKSSNFVKEAHFALNLKAVNKLGHFQVYRKEMLGSEF